MAKTSNIFTRVEPEIKEQAEQVLAWCFICQWKVRKLLLYSALCTGAGMIKGQLVSNTVY